MEQPKPSEMNTVKFLKTFTLDTRTSGGDKIGLMGMLFITVSSARDLIAMLFLTPELVLVNEPNDMPPAS